MSRLLRHTATSLVLALVAISASALEEGIDYFIAPDAAPRPLADDDIRVTEFFNFSCPACNTWQTYIDQWLVDIPADVSWVRSPVPFQRWDGLYARSFYVLQAFDREDLVSAFFRAYHGERKLLNSEGRVAAWLAEEHGLDEDATNQAFSSFGVDTKLRKTYRIIDRFGIASTPTFLVADRYILTPSLSKSPERLFMVLDELIAEIRSGTAT